MFPNHAEILRLAAQDVGLCKRHQMQMPIEFPEILDVSDQSGVTVVEQLAETKGCFHAGLGIAIPPRRRAGIDVPQREYIQPARRDAVGRGDVTRSIDSFRSAHPSMRCWRKVRRLNDLGAEQPGALRVYRKRAKKAMRNLGGRHAAQPVEAPPEPFLHSRHSARGFEPEPGFYEFMPGHIGVPERRGHSVMTRLSAGCT